MKNSCSNKAKKYYQNKVTCLSILTEEKFFQGNLLHISKVKKKINLPVLCKDFFIDPFQVHLAKSFGADSVLIILAAVTEKVAHQLYESALKLNMSVVIEVHTKNEAKNSLNFNDALIGINNRNLKTLETNIKNTLDVYNNVLLKKKHPGPIVCESGIKSEKEVEEIVKQTKINNFLIGESLLKDLDKKTSLLQRILKITP